MIYRKRGSVVRWENGTVIRVTESGVAIEEGERFECHPDPENAKSDAVTMLKLDDVQPLLIECKRIRDTFRL